MRSCLVCGGGPLIPKYLTEAGSTPVRYLCPMGGHSFDPEQVEEPVTCPNCGKKLAEELSGEAIFTCRHCKTRQLIRRY